jgi:hypothetical protein
VEASRFAAELVATLSDTDAPIMGELRDLCRSVIPETQLSIPVPLECATANP